MILVDSLHMLMIVDFDILHIYEEVGPNIVLETIAFGAHIMNINEVTGLSAVMFV